MRILIAAAVFSSLALSPQARGVVSKVTTGGADATGTVQITIEGTSPCGAVHLDYGDGTAVTHATSTLPVTIPYEYTKAGDFNIRASGMGNCEGAATTRVRVNRVRRPADPPAPTPAPAPPAAIRFKEMDENGDGVITRAEWRGNLQSFDEHDWNGDRRLSGEEVRVGAKRPEDWSLEQFPLFDTNNDTFISRGEWPAEPAEFVRVDRNRDDRISRDEFLNGDPDRRVTGRGRGRGVGAGTGPSVTAIVDSREDWTDAGLYVRRGETLVIDVTGTIHFSAQSPATGPEGAAGRRAPTGSPLPNGNIGALIARVGRSAPFLVGTGSDVIRAPIDGPLYLRINDDVLTDNRGEFRVTVSVPGGRGREPGR
jgi:hypothetical protein